MEEITTPLPEDTAPEAEETEAPDPVEEWQELQAQMEANLARRVQACTEEVTAVLDKYGLKLHVTAPQLGLIPK